MSPTVEKVYTVAFDLIEMRLKKREHILPFAVVLERKDAQPTISMFDHQTQDTSELLTVVRAELQKDMRDNTYVCYCLCFEVSVLDPRIGKSVDAISMELVDHENNNITVYVPYDFSDEQVLQKPFQVAS